MLRSLVKSCKQAATGLLSEAPLGPRPIVLFKFDSQKVLDKWHVFTDSYFGGKSQATLNFNADEQAAEFSGRCSTEQDDDADIKKAGYCVASSKVERVGDYFDLSGFSHLVFNVKGDGKTYIANVRVDSMAGTGGDIWQAPFRPSADAWSTVKIPIEGLALTYKGQLVERKLEFQAEKVIGVGVSVFAATSTAEHSSSAATAVDEFSRASSSSSSTAEMPVSTQQVASTFSTVYSSSSSSTSAGTKTESRLQVQQHQNPLKYPAHELFKLLIRDIRAEGEL